MIIHKLIAHHLKNKDDPTFYFFQAQDAIQWIERSGVKLDATTKALDLGCGHGVFGVELKKKGCQVTFADEDNYLLPEISKEPFLKINIDKEDIGKLGQFDLVICSNVLEHLAKPTEFLASAHKILSPQGTLYLSWTNWLSPWGGHEFSPFHYLGAKSGHKFYDKLGKPKRIHTPFENLYPTYIGRILKNIRQSTELKIMHAAPRYYPEFSFIVNIPIVREFLTWNCALLLGHRS